MYSISSKKSIECSHYLPQADNEEKKEHSHNYNIKIKFYGDSLKEKDYLINLEKIGVILEDIENKYSDKLLNELEEFQDKNPTIEIFSKLIWRYIIENYDFEKVKEIEIKIQEDEIGIGAYKGEINN